MKSLQDQFDEWLGGINYTKEDRPWETYKFWIRVGCVKACPPRHERFDLIREMGIGHIRDIFAGNPLPEHMTFVFPERHMSVHEQQAFMSVLNKHPDVTSGKVKTMDMLTSCALMISSFHREQILILEWSDDKIYLEACGNSNW